MCERTVGLVGLLLLGAACGPLEARPNVGTSAPSVPAPVTSTATTADALARTTAPPAPVVPETPLRDSGPLHLAATGPGPSMSCVANVEGGPILVPGQSNTLFAWDPKLEGFVERPDLGDARDAGCGLMGRLDGDLWGLRGGVKTTIVRRTASTPWREVGAMEGDVDIEPYGPSAILARAAPRFGKGTTAFQVFGDSPLPPTPRFSASSTPCSVDLAHGGFATFADGAVIVGSACYALWSPSLPKAKPISGFGRAVVALKRESSSSVIVFGSDEQNRAVLAHGDGKHWTRVDTDQLGKLAIWGAGRTADGAEWIMGEHEDEPRWLYRQAPGSKDWQRIVLTMGTSDPQEDRHTHVSMLDVVDGELWIRAEHASNIEGPYHYAVYTTRPTKRVVTTP